VAELVLEGNDIVVRLGLVEALATWRHQLRLPLRDLRMVQVDDEPLAGRGGLRLPGLYWPGTLALGPGRRSEEREFVAIKAHQPAVVLDFDGGPWARVVVSTPDAVGLAAALASVVLERGPGGGSGHGSKPSGLAGPGAGRLERGGGQVGQRVPVSHQVLVSLQAQGGPHWL
jgi:hypothetical protein